MFGFSRRKGDVLSHWYVLVDNFNYSTATFYSEIEKELNARQVPGLSISQVEFLEGGVLSDKRIYLRMLRERLTFDICAAPFGRAYFFSLRFVEIPVVVAWWQFVLAIGSAGILFGFMVDKLGLFFGGFLTLTICGGAILIARNPVALGFQDLDQTLIRSPVIGPLYERFIRKETYYRHDTRLMYLTMVSEIVKKKVEEVTAAKGVKLLESYESSPILGEIYKPKSVELKATASAAAAAV